MNPETIRPIAAFLRNLREGRPSTTEEWNAMAKFLEDGTVIARRIDWRYRTHEFFPELERWLRGNEDFLQYTDEQQVNVTGSHYHFWLKARPYPPPICFEVMAGEDRETGERRSLDEIAAAPEEKKDELEDVDAPEHPPRGRPPKKTS